MVLVAVWIIVTYFAGFSSVPTLINSSFVYASPDACWSQAALVQKDDGDRIECQRMVLKK